MMGIILSAELTVLFFLSRALTERLYALFYHMSHSRSVAITLLLLLQFPGTVIHELAHLFTAEILGVRTGKLSLVPENIRAKEIRAGSVMVARTDPFRKYAIGLAPIVVGMVVLAALSAFTSDWTNLTNWTHWTNWVVLYALFAVSNAMFSSREDLKGFMPFLVALGALIGVIWTLGLRIGITGSLAAFLTRIVETLATSLAVVLVINGVLFLLATIALWVVRR